MNATEQMVRSGRFVCAGVVVIALLSAESASAIDWIGPLNGAGWFDDPANWEGGAFPGTGDGATFKGGASVTYNATGQPGNSAEILDLRIGMDTGEGAGEVLFTGGTLILNDFDDEAVRMGQNGQTGGIIQSGGTIDAINGGVRIGDGQGETTVGEFGYYTISGGSVITRGPGDNGRMVVGDHDGNAHMTIVGTGPDLISVAARFEVESNGRLEFILDASGVTPIIANTRMDSDEPRFQGAEPDGDPGAMLLLDFSALTRPIGDILLVDNWSEDDFDLQAVNAPEGAIVHTFPNGTYYYATYTYMAPGGDGFANDLALVAIPEPSTCALMVLAFFGSLSHRRR
jgi:hypothetical protein